VLIKSKKGDIQSIGNVCTCQTHPVRRNIPFVGEESNDQISTRGIFALGRGRAHGEEAQHGKEDR
jgi:hypothetical protein